MVQSTTVDFTASLGCTYSQTDSLSKQKKLVFLWDHSLFQTVWKNRQTVFSSANDTILQYTQNTLCKCENTSLQKIWFFFLRKMGQIRWVVLSKFVLRFIDYTHRHMEQAMHMWFMWCVQKKMIVLIIAEKRKKKLFSRLIHFSFKKNSTRSKF